MSDIKSFITKIQESHLTVLGKQTLISTCLAAVFTCHSKQAGTFDIAWPSAAVSRREGEQQLSFTLTLTHTFFEIFVSVLSGPMILLKITLKFSINL